MTFSDSQYTMVRRVYIYRNDVSSQVRSLFRELGEFPCVYYAVRTVMLWSAFTSLCEELGTGLSAQHPTECTIYSHVY
jgi:hypothetical protein